MENLTSYLFKCSEPLLRNVNKNVIYTVSGEALKVRNYVADGNEPVTTCDYIVLDYCLKGMKRLSQKYQSVISGVKNDKEYGLLFMSEMITDGQVHRIIMPCESTTYDFLRLNLCSEIIKLFHLIFSFLNSYINIITNIFIKIK